jgi:hypothetical protein
MRYRIVCPCCGKKGRVPAEFRGRGIRCPRCGRKFRVSAQSIEDLAARLLLWPEGSCPVDDQDPAELYLLSAYLLELTVRNLALRPWIQAVLQENRAPQHGA